MSEWALTENDVVTNIIVVEDGDTFATDYVARDDNDYVQAVDLADLDPRPGIGWVNRDGTFLPPETLTTDMDEIPPNGATAATVAYTDNRPDPPATVEVDVNGDTSDLTLVDGVGTVAVTSTNPGDTVTVQVSSLTVVIGVSD